MFTKLLFFILFFTPAFILSQNNVYMEANPDNSYVEDNSEYARLFKKLIEAKLDRNTLEYETLKQILFTKYPSKFIGSDAVKDAPYVISGNPNPPFQTDWGTGDALVVPGPVYVPPANSPRAGLDIETDSLGNKYIGYISANRDTLRIMKSTNQGMNWFSIFSAAPGGTMKWHSFDFFITDYTSGVPRLGMVVCRTSSVSTFNGELWWIACNDVGGSPSVVLISSPPSGYGFINPTIVSDGFDFAPGVTYWYIAFQRYNITSSNGDQNLAALSMNWGSTWILDTVRNSYNDFSLDIEYREGETLDNLGTNYDSVYVAYCNDLTPSNPNLRINRISLANWGTATGWTQYNIAGTSDPETSPELASKRNTDEMAIVYTQSTGGNTDIKCNYTSETGSYWTNLSDVANYSNNCERPRIDCQQVQAAYRVCFISRGSLDTVVYTSSFTPPFVSRTTVSNNSPGATTTSPDILGFWISGSSYGGGVVFVGGGQTGLWYDGSNITPVGITTNEIPHTYSLSQNYPNPFNPSTTIDFSIPVNSFVTLKVFDILGREVATVIAKEMKAGNYSVDWNATDFNSGVYFYQLSTEGFTETKKMLLIK